MDRSHLVPIIVIALGSIVACDGKKDEAQSIAAKPTDVKVVASAQDDAKGPGLDGKLPQPDTKGPGLDGKIPGPDGKLPGVYPEEPQVDGKSPGAAGEPSIVVDNPDHDAFVAIMTRPAAVAPATVEDAAAQLGKWLGAPLENPVPALLLAGGEIEIAIHCGPCTDDPPPTTSKSSNAAEFGELARDLVYESAGWQFEAGGKCKDDCCSYGPYDAMDSDVTTIDTICVTRGADGKPTAYTRIDGTAY